MIGWPLEPVTKLVGIFMVVPIPEVLLATETIVGVDNPVTFDCAVLAPCWIVLVIGFPVERSWAWSTWPPCPDMTCP